MLPDNYTITYATTHIITPDNPMGEKLDITINETKSITTPSQLTLTAHNDDYLVVVDLPNSIKSYIKNPNSVYDSYFFDVANQTYKYGYYNVEGDLIIYFYNDSSGVTTNMTIPNATKNNVYHIVQGVNGNSTINIVPFDYYMIVW